MNQHGYDWFFRSEREAGKELPVGKTVGLIDPGKKLFAMSPRGKFPNRDMWLGDALV